jgi:hypothetical protein
MLGVGGGVIMIPLLTWAGLTQKRAQGTSLSATVPLAVVGAASYLRVGCLDLPSATHLAIGGVIGAYIGAGLVRRLSNRLLYRLFGAMLLVVAIRHAMTVLTVVNGTAGNPIPFLAFPAGVIAGFVSGFFGVGGGVVFVPAGVQFLGLGEKVAQGGSFVAIIPTAVIGFLRYHKTGETQGDAILPLIIGAVVGSLISSNIAVGIADVPLAIVFSVLLAAVALRRLIGINLQGK